MKRFLPGAATGLVSGLAVVACLAVPPVAAAGCGKGGAPAVFPVLDLVEQTILTDITAGKNYEQVIVDVTALLASQLAPTAVQPDVDHIVEAALSLLIDSGLVPANWLPTAKTMKATAHAKLVMKGVAQ